MSRIADVLEITSTEFDGRFEVLGCRYIVYSKFPNEDSLVERFNTYNERHNKKRLIDAILDDATKKSKNTDVYGELQSGFDLDIGLCNSIRAELDQIKKGDLLVARNKDEKVSFLTFEYKIKRNRIYLEYMVKPIEFIKKKGTKRNKK